MSSKETKHSTVSKWTVEDSVALKGELNKLKKNAKKLKKKATAGEKLSQEFDAKADTIDESIKNITEFANFLEKNSKSSSESKVTFKSSEEYKKYIIDKATDFED